MPAERTETMTVKMTAAEVGLRDSLAEYLGLDGSSVMRMALLEMGRSRGFEIATNNKRRPSPKT